MSRPYGAPPPIRPTRGARRPGAAEAPEAAGQTRMIDEPQVHDEVPQGSPTGTDDVVPPPRGSSRGIHDRWARVPLLARLVGISTLLLVTGLGIAGLVTTSLLSRYLVSQVDQRLTAEADNLTDTVIRYYNANGSLTGLTSAAWVPTDYAVAFTIDGHGYSTGLSEATQASYGVPALPDLTPQEAVDRELRPLTVKSTTSPAAWRAVVYPLAYGSAHELVGTATIALPLGDITSTVHRAALLLWSSAVAILVIGVIAGTWAVRRSLRPLTEIEDTAAAIAAGDLSRRVPTAPETTEVGRLGAALNGMLSQIERAFGARTASEERMRRFVADASHELRTPLATIRGYGELYRMGALTEKDQVDDTMRRIEQSATRMGGLVEDLLALARLDADRPGRSEPVDLSVLAADAAHDLRALDPTRAVRLTTLDGGAGGPCLVSGDEPRLRQVLANLIGNVARHTPAGTPAEIAVGRRDDCAVLEVRDHGPGIPPEHIARVFERFYRVDSSRARVADGTGGGAGLGMAIVAAIVDAHSGKVELLQTEGGGTTVRIALRGTGSGGEPVDEWPEDDTADGDQASQDVPTADGVEARDPRDDTPAPDRQATRSPVTRPDTGPDEGPGGPGPARPAARET